ncbi:unnamed protein product [Victoria cruziana]
MKGTFHDRTKKLRRWKNAPRDCVYTAPKRGKCDGSSRVGRPLHILAAAEAVGDGVGRSTIDGNKIRTAICRREICLAPKDFDGGLFPSKPPFLTQGLRSRSKTLSLAFNLGFSILRKFHAMLLEEKYYAATLRGFFEEKLVVINFSKFLIAKE